MGLELESELLVEGGAGGLLGLWVCWVCVSVMVGLCDGGFVVRVALWVFFMVVCGGLRWWICTCSGFAISEIFILFYFILFYVAPNTVKYFQTIFRNANKHWKNNHFP